MSSCLVLAGPPGVGKSTVGARCAARLGWRLVDTDEELVRQQGLPVAEIFARHGEAHFRQLEAALCRDLATASQLVIATGGGTIVHEPTRAILLQHGVGICLTAATAELARRLGAEAGLTRPLLRPQDPTDTLPKRLDALLHARAPAYAALPYHLDTTGMNPDAVAEIACALVAAQHERMVVCHPAGRYDLALGAGLLDYVGYALAGRGYSGPLAIVSDTNVGPLYAARVQASLLAAGLPSFIHLFPAGEVHKNLATLESLYHAFRAGGLERGGAVIALGGGVVGDTAGLAAATYLRGVALIQVPTSLLAMADSSIGGKVGVDLAGGKNLVGAFKQPDLVLLDLHCLRTLPAAELRSGLGEVVKAALIAGGEAYARIQALATEQDGAAVTQLNGAALLAPMQDGASATQLDGATPLGPMRDGAALLGPVQDGAAFTQLDGATRLGTLLDSAALLAPLRDALALKRTLVQEDPHEQGRRILLNLGHTFAHGLEPFFDYRLRHGDAVSLGLVCAARLAARLGLCAPEFPAELTTLLQKLGLPTILPFAEVQEPSQKNPTSQDVTDDKSADVDQAVERIWGFMQHDKKRRARRSRFVLLRAPGNVFTCDLVDDQLAKDALRTLWRSGAPGKVDSSPHGGASHIR